MIKFVHCADIHIASGFGFLNGKRAAESEEENFRAFKNLLRVASARGAEFVLIAGDLFSSVNMDSENFGVVADLFKSYPSMDFYISAGNNDPWRRNCIYQTFPFSPNVTVFGDVPRTVVKGGYTVSGFSNANGADNPDFSGLTPKKGKFNILLLHCNVPCAEPPFYSYYSVDEDCLPADINYLALGHVHKYQTGKFGDAVYAYAGSLSSRGAREDGWPHGFLYCEADDKGALEIEFIKREAVKN